MPLSPVDYTFTALGRVLYPSRRELLVEGENVPQSYNTLQSSDEVISVSTSPSAAGTCPRCGEAVPTHRLLIEYETTDGPAAFAECPTCGDVVHPEPA